ncbi:hypothetical protein HanRHA438_Chr15g0729681 [Helianthus annuus]|uniref:Uncharacterized protein n=1 Tax=Helianthus annuus TaxID=4232 RepID=A0A9K3E420_HELAN|nr:hypothetical protein HanXRQr2_Chr15g0717521 [Helianthus annuus]KAJ0452975.1 hypothetical protein HanHA300_Chr15g0585111 [Helianthus annuus]KAJ0474891.1 hypothetical protein HanHA89_Chr15g0634891 [Helianthus annuus]KAJ0650447.1 hypothetical protein HanLR1_Chr15g0595821 [Helianthus annuus]KAJ0654201.1 hypothetical protein HanOQP8_Chr15g0592251 [Helianthus annuus]
MACERDNEQMFAARTKFTNLKACVEELKKSESDYKDKYEEAKSHRERVEILQVELSQQIITRDKDLAGKDVEIPELKRRLREVQESLEAEKQKSDSLEIDLTVEKVKAETAEEVFKIANSILYAKELDRAVAALTMVARATGHQVGYVECATHVEERLLQAEENYDNLSLPIMGLVTEALKHED